MDQRGVLLMDKTWRSRVFGQGRTRSGGPRLCADRSGAKNSTPFCEGGGYTVNWTLKRRYGTRKSKRDEQCTSQQKVDTTLYFYTSFNEHNTPYTVLESDNSESMPDVLH